MTPKKMERASNALVILDEDVDSALRHVAECERECSAQTLMDDKNKIKLNIFCRVIIRIFSQRITFIELCLLRRCPCRKLNTV
jgi:hypothetical protein